MNSTVNTLATAPAVEHEQICKMAESVALPVALDEARRNKLFARARQLLKEKNAVLVAHYYTDADLQQLADETGGFVSDSLDMARFGHEHPASTLIVAGVRFMGETAKILNPEKRVLMPALEAECSLDLSCPADAFNQFCDAHPDRTVVVYANTSAAVKARADWVVTSSIATEVIAHLHAQGKSILWAPDKYLGHYVQSVTGADMAHALESLKQQHPEAAVLVHPESPADVIELADVVGSTTALIKAAQQLDNPTFIVATDNGIFYKMQQAAPDKTFYEAPNAGIGASCESCAHCPWMAINSLENLISTLETSSNEIQVDPQIREQAMVSLQRMLDFSAATRNQPAQPASR